MSKTVKSIVYGCIKGFFLGSGIGYWLAVLRLAVKKPDEAKQAKITTRIIGDVNPDIYQ